MTIVKAPALDGSTVGGRAASGRARDGAPIRVATARRASGPPSTSPPRYSMCWEDPAVLLQGLDPGPGTRVLSVASGGENTLTLLGSGASVVAADPDAAQLACLELKCAALGLSRGDALAFIGILPCAQRWSLYRSLRGSLSPWARAYWDGAPAAIEAGVIHSGRFEGLFRAFRRAVLPLMHGPATVAELLRARDLEGRRRFYAERWDTWRWRLLFKAFFSRFAMSRLGRDGGRFRLAEGPVAAPILRRARRALTELETHSNPFLEYILTGGFRRNLPSCFEPGAFERIGASLGRLSLFHGTAEEASAADPDGFDAFNLSDIFETMDAAAFQSAGRALMAAARPGARLAYWNMLVPRRLSREFPGRLEFLEGRARELAARDRAFFYGDFILEECPGKARSAHAGGPR